jgi:TolB-like protein
VAIQEINNLWLGAMPEIKALDRNKCDEISFKNSFGLVGDCLDKLLGSKQLAGSKSLKTFLQYLVIKTQNSQEHQIKEYSLGVDVFHRKETFDPRIDPIVRVQAHRLRLKIKAHYSAEGRYETMRIDVPKGCYVPVIYQYSGVDLPSESNFLRCRIAVLPFLNLSSESPIDHFIDVLREDLIAALTRSDKWDVIARTSDLTFKEQYNDIRRIGRYFNVDAILEGSVQSSTQMFRVGARLVNAKTGLTIWGTTVDIKPNSDQMAAQREILTSIVPHIIARLGDHK